MRDKRVKILPEILFQEINGETVLLNLNNECYFGLDAVGTRVWQLLQNETSLQNIVNIMLDEYDVEAKLLESDIDELLNNMVKADIVEVIED